MTKVFLKQRGAVEFARKPRRKVLISIHKAYRRNKRTLREALAHMPPEMKSLQCGAALFRADCNLNYCRNVIAEVEKYAFLCHGFKNELTALWPLVMSYHDLAKRVALLAGTVEQRGGVMRSSHVRKAEHIARLTVRLREQCDQLYRFLCRMMRATQNMSEVSRALILYLIGALPLSTIKGIGMAHLKQISAHLDEKSLVAGNDLMARLEKNLKDGDGDALVLILTALCPFDAQFYGCLSFLANAYHSVGVESERLVKHIMREEKATDSVRGASGRVAWTFMSFCTSKLVPDDRDYRLFLFESAVAFILSEYATVRAPSPLIEASV